MSLVYELTYKQKKYNYVSLYQNHIASSFRSSLQTGSIIATDRYMLSVHKDSEAMQDAIAIPMNEAAISIMIDDLIEYDRKAPTLVWDARHMVRTPVHALEKRVTQLLSPGFYQRVYFLLPCLKSTDDIRRIFSHNVDWTIDFKGDSKQVVTVSRANSKPPTLWVDVSVERARADIDEGLARYLFYATSSDIEFEPVFSSNVYANRYFNAKGLLKNPAIFSTVVFQLVERINSRILSKGDDFDAFICASVNGACIASAVSTIIKKPVIFLRNVGPDMTVRDKYMTERIKFGKKYVYLFDFMCLGTEYQRTKMLCALRKALLIYSVGISHYRKPLVRAAPNKENRDHLDIDTLFNINEIGPDKNYYYCCIDRAELQEKQKQMSQKKLRYKTVGKVTLNNSEE